MAVLCATCYTAEYESGLLKGYSMGFFSQWKRTYIDMLNLHNDLGEEFKEVFSPQVFDYSVREAFLYFSGFTLAIYAILAKKIDRKAQSKFASLQLDQIYNHFGSKEGLSISDLSNLLESRQNEVIDIIAKAVSKEVTSEEALIELTDAIYNNVFSKDSEQYNIVQPLLLQINGSYLSRALKIFRG